jgi:hypothetical protein
MATRKIRFGLLVLILLLGLMIGTAVGKMLGVILPEGAVRSFFVEGLHYVFGPLTLNFVVASIKLEFTLDINVMGVLGVILLAQLLRWY